jgi:AcrR family transcriptional regulator
MPRLTDARRQLRYDELIGAARSEFARHGYEAASISGIASVASVSDGLLYRYFADKKALLVAVLERYMGEVIARAEEAVFAEQGFGGRIERLIAIQLGAFADEPALCQLFIRELRAAADYPGSPLQDQMRRYTALVLRIVADARAASEIAFESDPRLLRDMIFGGIEHIAWRTLAGGEGLDPSGIAAQLAALICNGALGRAAK